MPLESSLSSTQNVKDSSEDNYWTLTLDLGLIWRSFLVVTATFLSHWQAIGGGFIWDDDAHVTRMDLRSLEGLWLIWSKLGATQQYYPLLHSIFWFEQAVWGDVAVYYHIANILFHTIAVFALVAVLKKLSIPGAWVAGFIFALHPVHVESVAWVTEQKNTISAIFYLFAAFYYVQFDEKRQARDYKFASLFFILALLSKTVTATLPAALLLIFWWKRGKLEFKKDILPLLPWFAIGAIGGVFTAWVERVYIGANGTDFLLTPVMRCLLAGHVIWFYLGKLLWPSNLIFIYEHWNINSSDVVQYFYPFAVIAIVALLGWFALKPLGQRKADSITRAPLVGFLFFCGTLFPVLGFANVYPFMFSYVADHFQYLASLGIIVPFASGVTLLVEKLSNESKAMASAIGGVLLALLGVLSWNQCSMYKDGETLYRETIERNPLCWMAHNNLGAIWLNKGHVAEAQEQFEEAIRIRPPYADAQSNLSMVLLRTGRPQEAIVHATEALRLRESPENENNLAASLAGVGRFGDAIPHYQMALRMKPNFTEALNNLGNAYLQLGHRDEALNALQTAIKYMPNFADPYENIGFILIGAGRLNEGIQAYEQAVKLVPNAPMFRINLANAYLNAGRAADAINQYQEAIKINPNNPDPWYYLANCYVNLGKFVDAEQPYLNTLKLNSANIGAENNLAAVYFKLGRIPDAIGHYMAALKLNSNYAEAHNNLGVALAASKLFKDSISEYNIAIKLKPDYADAYNNLGLAYSTIEDFKQAVVFYKKAIELNAKNSEYHDNLAKAFKSLGKTIESNSEQVTALKLRSPVAPPKAH